MRAAVKADMTRVLVLNDDETMLDVYEAAMKELAHQPVTKVILESGPETVREVAADTRSESSFGRTGTSS